MLQINTVFLSLPHNFIRLSLGRLKFFNELRGQIFSNMPDKNIEFAGDIKSSKPPTTHSDAIAHSDTIAHFDTMTHLNTVAYSDKPAIEVELLLITLTEEAVCCLWPLAKKLAEPPRLEYSDSEKD